MRLGVFIGLSIVGSAVFSVACSGDEFSGGSDTSNDASPAAGGRTSGESDAGSGGRRGGAGGSVVVGAGGSRAGTGGSSDIDGGDNIDASADGSAITADGSPIGSDSGSVEDAAPTPLTACPANADSLATARCIGEFECSYGADPRPSCRDVYRCRNGKFDAVLADCTTPRNCYDGVSQAPFNGNVCPVPDDFCAWDSGFTCQCTACSLPACKGPWTWICAPPAQSPCPTTPPNVGQPCESSGQNDCTYGACGLSSSVTASCQGHVWSWSFCR